MNRQISICLCLSLVVHTLAFLTYYSGSEQVASGKVNEREREVLVFLDHLTLNVAASAPRPGESGRSEPPPESLQPEPIAPPSAPQPDILPQAVLEDEVRETFVSSAPAVSHSEPEEDQPRLPMSSSDSSPAESVSEQESKPRPIRATENSRAAQPRAIDTPASDNSLGPVEISQPSYLRYVQPKYPSLAIRSGHQGLVVVIVEIDPAGRASNVSVERSSGFSLLDNAAVRAARQARYQPALRGGRQVASRASARYRFQLPGSLR